MEFPKVRIHECKPLKPNPKLFNRKTQGCMQREAQTCWLPRDGNYRDRLKSMQILLSRSQAGPGRTGKQEQGQTSHNHVQAFQPISVYQHQFWNIFYWKQTPDLTDTGTHGARKEIGIFFQSAIIHLILAISFMLHLTLCGENIRAN